MATLLALDLDGGDHARSIGIGLSPGDGSYAEPYFYISPWPYPSQPDLPAVMAPAFWHREDFTAVILRGSDFVSMNNDTQHEKATLIIDNAIKLYGNVEKSRQRRSLASHRHGRHFAVLTY